MKKQIIALAVKPISHIKELSAQDGTRQLDFPYFVDDDGEWTFCMVNERTDPNELQRLINDRRVYIYFDLNHK